MLTFEYLICDAQGLHARNSLSLCKLAEGFQSTVTIQFGSKKANCKHLLEIMSLGASQNSKLQFYVEGEDETDTMKMLQAVLPTIL